MTEWEQVQDVRGLDRAMLRSMAMLTWQPSPSIEVARGLFGIWSRRCSEHSRVNKTNENEILRSPFALFVRVERSSRR